MYRIICVLSVFCYNISVYKSWIVKKCKIYRYIKVQLRWREWERLGVGECAKKWWRSYACTVEMGKRECETNNQISHVCINMSEKYAHHYGIKGCKATTVEQHTNVHVNIYEMLELILCLCVWWNIRRWNAHTLTHTYTERERDTIYT